MTHDCPTGGRHRIPEYSCYNNCGCRCDGCREAARQYNRQRDARIRRALQEVRAERPPLKPLPTLDVTTVPLLDLPWYQDRRVS